MYSLYSLLRMQLYIIEASYDVCTLLYKLYIYAYIMYNYIYASMYAFAHIYIYILLYFYI